MKPILSHHFRTVHTVYKNINVEVDQIFVNTLFVRIKAIVVQWNTVIYKGEVFWGWMLDCRTTIIMAKKSEIDSWDPKLASNN